MEEIQCPACGSHDIETSRALRSYATPFGHARSYEIEVATCRTCRESGDFRGVNSASIKKAIEEADKESVDLVLGWLSKAGISMAYLERALSLPPRTVARWKSGGCSASGLALLRIVRTFPWILEVAAARFSAPAASLAIIKAAADTIATAASSAGYTYSLTASPPKDSSLEVHVHFKKELVGTLATSAGLTPCSTEKNAA
jgi:hypothetical protein